jgi:hypothetical protein
MSMAMRKPAPEPSDEVPRPEEIRERLEAARARISELLVEQQRAAADSFSAEGEERYQKIIAEMASTSGEVDRLEAALAGMQRQAEEKASAEQRAVQQELRDRVAKLLDRRVDAARKFEASIRAAVAALGELSSLSNDAYAAWPGPSPPDVLGQTEITHLISHELFRLGVKPMVTGGISPGRYRPPDLPAPKSPGFEYTDQPERVPALVGSIEQANAHAKNILEGGR